MTISKLPFVPQRYPSWLKPWVIAAMLLGIAVLGYDASVGVRYWMASQQIASLTSSIDQLVRAPIEPLPDDEALQERVAAQESRLNELLGSLSDFKTDDLISILVDTAEKTPINLTSMTIGDRRAMTRAGIQYGTQPLAIVLEGRTENLYRFLTLLHETAPMTAVSGIRMADLDGSPSAQVQLLFYLSPEVLPKEEKSK